MKIEMGESLLLSWLKHIKECQLVQTNWKASNKWVVRDTEVIERFMQSSKECFLSKYGYDIYKGNKTLNQLLGQAEIDVLGVCMEENSLPYLYAVDVAFHEAGLNYGSRTETVSRVIKKCLRTAMCLYAYFGTKEGTILFVSPKISPRLNKDLHDCVDDMNQLIQDASLNYNVRIISNESFADKILNPVLHVLGEVADTSELFMRSMQMFKLFARTTDLNIASETAGISQVMPAAVRPSDAYEASVLEEMKIGVIVRTVLRRILSEGKVPADEIEKLQTKAYSKETFDLQYPLLVKASATRGESPRRYYATPLLIDDEAYFLCSEWYEVPGNNDRPYLMKWLATYLQPGA